METVMNSQTIVVVSTFSVIAYALVSGVFLAFSGVVMPSLAASNPAGAIQSMQIINRKVFPTVFMVLLIGMAIVSPMLVGWVLWRGAGPAEPWILAAGASYMLGVFIVTLVFNVPMNERLHRMDPQGGIAEAYWRRYVPGWTFWNTIRWVASAISAACMLIAVLALN